MQIKNSLADSVKLVGTWKAVNLHNKNDDQLKFAQTIIVSNQICSVPIKQKTTKIREKTIKMKGKIETMKSISFGKSNAKGKNTINKN